MNETNEPTKRLICTVIGCGRVVYLPWSQYLAWRAGRWGCFVCESCLARVAEEDAARAAGALPDESTNE